MQTAGGRASVFALVGGSTGGGGSGWVASRLMLGRMKGRFTGVIIVVIFYIVFIVVEVGYVMTVFFAGLLSWDVSPVRRGCCLGGCDLETYVLYLE